MAQSTLADVVGAVSVAAVMGAIFGLLSTVVNDVFVVVVVVLVLSFCLPEMLEP